MKVERYATPLPQLTLDDTAERRFYELESAANQWSVRERQRQIASSLYQRLALSRDKEEIRRPARKGQVVEKAADLIKNPIVLVTEDDQLDGPHYIREPFQTEPGWGVSSVNYELKALLERARG